MPSAFHDIGDVATKGPRAERDQRKKNSYLSPSVERHQNFSGRSSAYSR
jgi:hypothetical protein